MTADMNVLFWGNFMRFFCFVRDGMFWGCGDTALGTGKKLEKKFVVRPCHPHYVR
jgi:hypothetical protein